MRIRSVKPEFWQSETMSSVDPFSRLMAIALLNLSDDHGYFNATPAVVRGEVFPFEETLASVSRALAELSRVGYIRIGTTSGGKRVGNVVNFKSHQKVDHPSRLTFNVDSIVWDGKTDDPSRDSRETVANPRATLDQERGAWSVERGAGSVDQQAARISASDWEPLREHRDLCAVRNADCDLQLSRFRERNIGQTDTDQGWGVRFMQWLGRAKPERSVPAEAVASPTLDQWIEEGKALNNTNPKNPEWSWEACEAIWHENQAKGWRYVQDWKASIRAAYNRFVGQENHFSNRRR